jgi:hypothetical protein
VRALGCAYSAAFGAGAVRAKARLALRARIGALSPCVTVLNETHPRNVLLDMRMVAIVIGLVGLLVGAVWIGQGAGWIAGSFMTGQRLWLVIGIVVAIIGLGLVIGGVRRPVRS